jgi:transposase
MGQGGREGRLAEAAPALRLRSLRHWVVERTFAWLCHSRRMSKDYEGLCVTGEAFVYVAMTHLMIRRLAHA